MKGIIFDLDGVLVNSMPLHVDAWIQAFQNIVDISVQKRAIYLLEGMRGEDLAAKIIEENHSPHSESGLDQISINNDQDKNKELARKVVKEKDRLFKALARPKSFPSVKEMINGLTCKMAVVSGSSRYDVESILEDTIGKDNFNAIITADDIKQGKPNPMPFTAALAKLQIHNAKDAIVVENAPLGVQAANNAGIQCYVTLNNTLLGLSDFDGIIPSARIFKETSSLAAILAQECHKP